jgi:outer-membrane receptor for ferric coprogen and ferric-rhodotorulic acid
VKLTTLAAMTTVAAVCPLDVTASEAGGSKCRLNLRSQPLDDALQEVSRQCSVQILYFSDISTGKTTLALEGEHRVDEALRLLLEDSGLTFRSVNASTFEITRAPAPGDAPRVARQSSRADSANEAAVQEVVIHGTVKDLVATRTETPLREIPQSISIISGEQIRQQNHLSLYDALEDAVGISSAHRGTYSTFLFSRGFSLASYTLDGGGGLRSVAHTPALPFVLVTPDLSEFDRIEVLRGSNALFGADATPGGAINLVRKRPLDKPAIRFSASAGSWENYRQELDATGPLALDGALRGRLVVSNASRNYFYQNADDQRQSVFGVLDYDMTEDTLLTAGGSYLKSRGRPFEKGLLIFSDGSDPRVPRDTSYVFDWTRFDTRVAEGFVRLEQAFGADSRLRVNATFIDNSVTYALGYHSAQLNVATGRAARPGSQYTLEPYVQTQLNVEATLTGKLWNDRAEWILGGDYLNAESETYTAQGGAFGAPIDPYNFDPAAYPYPIVPVTPLPLATANEVATRITGLFASLRVHIFEPWSVTAGLRLSDESVTDTLINYWSGTGFPTLRDFEHNDVLTPYIGTLFTLNDTWSLYASYADTFQNNNGLQARTGTALAETEGVTMEAGVKGSWRNGALNGSLAMYRILQRGVALREPITPTVPLCCYTTAGKSESEGVELEVSGQLASRWMIAGGYTFNQNRRLTPGTLLYGPTGGLAKHILRLWTDYALPGSWSRWSIGGSLNAESDAPRSSRIEQKSFAVISPRVSYDFDGRWQLALAVNNLLDKKYYATGFSSLWYGEPRSYMARLDARF